ncbi:MAG TPA: AMP-binding protein [Acidimicrobiales bacterium]|nr:AMP-binding protein [Acidimicrobiales bacterium]
MADLVAIDLPGGPEFVHALQATWDAGDAVAPLDQRLAGPARERLLEVLRPARVMTPGGTEERHDGLPVNDGDALVVATSASTGDAKGVVLTHKAVAASAKATSARLGADPATHHWLACLPLSHIGGLSVVTRSLVTGTPLTVLDGFDAAEVSAASGPTVLVSLVPTALARVGADRFFKVLLGGSAPPGGLAANVVVTYGMTETGSGVVYDGWPLDGVETSTSASGEVRLRCPMLLRAYRDGTVPLDEDGWFPTGDAGTIDGEGKLHIKGRLSDMIITGGENVWPVAVERILRQHPGVADVAVSSKPDPEWGERIVACVVPAAATGAPELEELRALVSEQFAAFAAPKELLLVTGLPKTSIGKLRRQALREQLCRPSQD